MTDGFCLLVAPGSNNGDALALWQAHARLACPPAFKVFFKSTGRTQIALKKIAIWRLVNLMIADALLQPPDEGGLSRGVWIMSKPFDLITGALAGIGRATAVAFAQRRRASHHLRSW